MSSNETNQNARKQKAKHIMTLMCRSAVVVALAYLLASVMTMPLSFSLGAVSAMSSTDFSITDMYQIVANSRDVRSLSPDIAIVDVNNCNRAQIAETIELVKLCDPKAIGVDVSFVDRRDDDDALVNSIMNSENMVTVKMLNLEITPPDLQNTDTEVFSIKHQSWFADMPSGVTYSAANFPTQSQGGTIRRFKKEYRMTDGSTLPSFACALADKVCPDQMKKLRDRGNDTELIYYPSTEFKILMPGELYDRAEELTGKVVLVGVLNDPGDLHRTPIDAHMSGTMIQAYALNTILKGYYLKECPSWVRQLVALIITYIFVFCSLYITSGYKGLTLRFFQVAALYLLLYAGYWFFIEKGVVADFSRSFLMLTFAFFSVDVWNGLYAAWEDIRNWKEKRKKRLAYE